MDTDFTPDPQDQLARLRERAAALAAGFAEIHGGLEHLLDEMGGAASRSAREELDTAQERIRDLEARLAGQEEELAALRLERDRQAASLGERFAELAVLTRLLEDQRRAAAASKPGKGGKRKSASPPSPIPSPATAPPAEEQMPDPPWHVLDLRTDSLLATVALNHVAIERAAGLGPSVWNAGGVAPAGFAWQARRLAAMEGFSPQDAPPGPGSTLFVYGLRLLEELIGAGLPAGLRLQALVSLREERAAAEEALAKAGLSGRALLAGRFLFAGREPAAGSGRDDTWRDTWPAALHLGLFDDPGPGTRIVTGRVGLSLQGRRLAARDERLVAAIGAALPDPLVVLADEADRKRLRELGAEVVVVNRARNFWSDFFDEVGTLVDWPARMEEVQVTSAAAQALQRGRLLALLTEEAPPPGVAAFARPDALLAHLREVTASPERHAAALRDVRESVSATYGRDFHLRRLNLTAGQGDGAA
ncbi:hypothetical protein VQH23_06715 [Pararoseomonas sp. SCSIO 73927]|uniref:hypothetical protein n=1 Tax=Pararoseomonas sp. SCSIO 73927 TaxID=3114537 RepID=UPI0030CB13C6